MVNAKEIVKQREAYEKTAKYQLNSAIDNICDIKFNASECNFSLAVKDLLDDTLTLLRDLKNNLQG